MNVVFLSHQFFHQKLDSAPEKMSESQNSTESKPKNRIKTRQRQNDKSSKHQSDDQKRERPNESLGFSQRFVRPIWSRCCLTKVTASSRTPYFALARSIRARNHSFLLPQFFHWHLSSGVAMALRFVVSHVA